MDDSDFVEITFDLGLTEAQTATLKDAQLILLDKTSCEDDEIGICGSTYLVPMCAGIGILWIVLVLLHWQLHKS